jgi:hypothetical protein
VAAILAAALPEYAVACGWWGDGEMSRHGESIDVSAKGSATIPGGDQAAKIPGEEGYGIALFQPERAVPYLRAVQGRPVNTIKQLKDSGFSAVIDLGTQSSTAKLHRIESESVGIRYISIPISGSLPSKAQVALFSATVDTASHRPLVVYAPDITLLGDMWVLHRLNQGALHGTAIGEGLEFGISEELKTALGVK